MIIYDAILFSYLASAVSPFHLILPKSTLAKDLCDAFERYKNIILFNWFHFLFLISYYKIICVLRTL